MFRIIYFIHLHELCSKDKMEGIGTEEGSSSKTQVTLQSALRTKYFPCVMFKRCMRHVGVDGVGLLVFTIILVLA